MITWNDLKHLDVSHIDLARIDLARFDVRTIELPKFDMPTFDMPTFDLPATDLTEFDRMTGLARDAAYAGVGAAVVTALKLDEHRRQLTDQVVTRVRHLVAHVA